MLYVVDHHEDVVRRLVQFLQGSDFAGVIFSRIPVEGTFPLEQVRLNSANPAPDLVVSLRWTDDKNQYGAPGLVTSEGGKKNDGTHASLSRFDMHNTLVAAGPDFRQGFIDALPTGNADVAPTILSILGVKPKIRMDGRVLEEALIHGKEPPAPMQKTIRAQADVGVYQWNQYLRFSTIGSQIYFDEGNGASEPR